MVAGAATGGSSRTDEEVQKSSVQVVEVERGSTGSGSSSSRVRTSFQW